MQLRSLCRIQLAAAEDDHRWHERPQTGLDVLDKLNPHFVGGYPIENNAVQIIRPDDIERFLCGPDVDNLHVWGADVSMNLLTKGICIGDQQEFLRTDFH